MGLDEAAPLLSGKQDEKTYCLIEIAALQELRLY
jgi:hypothetical protein